MLFSCIQISKFFKNLLLSWNNVSQAESFSQENDSAVQCFKPRRSLPSYVVCLHLPVLHNVRIYQHAIRTFICEIYLKVQGIDIPDIPASMSQLIRGPGI